MQRITHLVMPHSEPLRRAWLPALGALALSVACAAGLWAQQPTPNPQKQTVLSTRPKPIAVPKPPMPLPPPPASPAPTTPVLENPRFTVPVTLDLVDADLPNLFRMLADTVNLSAVMDSDVPKHNVTYRCNHLPWFEVIEAVTRENGLEYEIKGTKLRIGLAGKVAPPTPAIAGYSTPAPPAPLSTVVPAIAPAPSAPPLPAEAARRPASRVIFFKWNEKGLTLVTQQATREEILKALEKMEALARGRDLKDPKNSLNGEWTLPALKPGQSEGALLTFRLEGVTPDSVRKTL